jgi:hypothetical protein
MRKLFFLLCLTLPVYAAEPPFKSGTNEEIISYIDHMVKTNVRDKTTLASMAALLQDPNASVGVRERVAWAMGQLDMRSDVNKLIAAARDKGLLVRSAALNALIRMRARSAYPVLLDIAKSDPVLTLRQRAVLGMGLLRWEKAVNDLAQLSSDERPEVRAAAVLAMAATHSKKNDFSQILKEMKTDPDPYVQARAQTALDLVQGKRDVIASFLESDDADTRLFTAQYYHYQGTQADLKQVKDAANGESDDAVRAELKDAARAIEKRAEAQKKAAAQKAAPKPVIKKKK